MVEHAPTWNSFRRHLVWLLQHRANDGQVWLLLAEHEWLREQLRPRTLSPLVLTECLFLLTRAISRLSSEAISSWRLRDLLRLIERHGRSARDSATLLAATPRETPARIVHQRTINVLPSPQRAVLTLHLKGLSLTESANVLRLSTYATYSIWRAETLRLAGNLSAL